MRKASSRRWKSTSVQPIPPSSICSRKTGKMESGKWDKCIGGGNGFLMKFQKISHLAAK